MNYRLLLIDPISVMYADDVGNIYETPPADCTDVPSIAEAMQQLRQKRNNDLLQCDYTQLPDAPLTPAQVEAFRDYRQALRDYPGSVDVDTWTAPTYPTKPVI